MPTCEIEFENNPDKIIYIINGATWIQHMVENRHYLMRKYV